VVVDLLRCRGIVASWHRGVVCVVYCVLCLVNRHVTSRLVSFRLFRLVSSHSCHHKVGNKANRLLPSI